MGKVKCPKCDGTEFIRLAFSYIWEYEIVDTDTGEARTEELERDFQDMQEDWHCAVCQDYWPNYDDEGDDEVLDKLSDMWYN